MNLYFVYGSGPDARIVTPALTGTLLPGVTRDSLLTLAGELGYTAEEGKISTDEWQEGNASGAHHRGVRLRHRRGHHPGRLGQERRPASGRSATARPARSPCSCASS